MRLVCVFAMIAGACLLASAQKPAQQERIAELKQALQQSKAQLQKYEWIETTTVLLKGEVKSQKQNRCYYGVDGTLQKVPIAAPLQEQPRGRLKRRIIAKKKEEMTDYMQRAVELIHRYVPPDPVIIQAAKDHGKATFDVFEPNKVIRLSFSNLIKPGDWMAATLDIRSSTHILDLNVTTYLDSNEDGVVLKVTFDRLADGTSYSRQTTLDARSKQIKVVVENTGHRRTN